MKAVHVEVGDARKIKLKQLLAIYHRSGNPASEAKLIRTLSELELSQKEIAEKLGVAQSFVSRRLKLFDLLPELFERVEAGALKARTAYMLARLSKKEQEEFLSEKHVTLKQASAAVRMKTLDAGVRTLISEENPERIENANEKQIAALQARIRELTEELELQKIATQEWADAWEDLATVRRRVVELESGSSSVGMYRCQCGAWIRSGFPHVCQPTTREE